MDYILFSVLSILSVYLEPVGIAVLGVSLLLVVWGSIVSIRLKLSGALWAVFSSVFVDVTLKTTLGLHLLLLVLYYFISNILSALIPDDSFAVKALKTFVSVYLSSIVFELLKSGNIAQSFFAMNFVSSLITMILILCISYGFSFFQGQTDTSGFKLKI